MFSGTNGKIIKLFESTVNCIGAILYKRAVAVCLTGEVYQMQMNRVQKILARTREEAPSEGVCIANLPGSGPDMDLYIYANDSGVHGPDYRSYVKLLSTHDF